MSKEYQECKQTIEELQAINKKCEELGWLDNTTTRTLEYADNPITP